MHEPNRGANAGQQPASEQVYNVVSQVSAACHREVNTWVTAVRHRVQGYLLVFELVLCSSNHLVFARDVYDVRPVAYENRCRHTRPVGLDPATPQNAP